MENLKEKKETEIVDSYDRDKFYETSSRLSVNLLEEQIKKLEKEIKDKKDEIIGSTILLLICVVMLVIFWFFYPESRIDHTFFGFSLFEVYSRHLFLVFSIILVCGIIIFIISYKLDKIKCEKLKKLAEDLKSNKNVNFSTTIVCKTRIKE